MEQHSELSSHRRSLDSALSRENALSLPSHQQPTHSMAEQRQGQRLNLRAAATPVRSPLPLPSRPRTRVDARPGQLGTNHKPRDAVPTRRNNTYFERATKGPRRSGAARQHDDATAPTAGPAATTRPDATVAAALPGLWIDSSSTVPSSL